MVSFVWQQLARTAALHCGSATRAIIEINGNPAQLAHLLVVLSDPQPHRLELGYRLWAFPEFSGRAAVLLSSHCGPAADWAGGRSARARSASRCRRRRHCVFCSLRCLSPPRRRSPCKFSNDIAQPQTCGHFHVSRVSVANGLWEM